MTCIEKLLQSMSFNEMSKVGAVIPGGMDGDGSRRKEQALSEPGSVQPTSALSSLKSLASIIYFQFPMSPQDKVPTTAPFVVWWG